MTLTEPKRQSGASGQFILLHERDNILVCARKGSVGEAAIIDGRSFLLTSDIELGHKIARVPLEEGDKVFRYGIAIGSMASPAKAGDHIHSHNLKSDYIAAHGRDAVRIREI